jgi:hypothetical protein
MDELIVRQIPRLERPTIVMGLTGWMDSGRVSTGAIEHFATQLGGEGFAQIDPMGFYIFNFPVATIPVTVVLDGEDAQVSTINPMEFTAIFRPHAQITDGVIRELRTPRNEFYRTQSPELVLFHGEEPHIRWGAYCNCILELADRMATRQIVFVGSVASPIPHTRVPRLRCSAATEEFARSIAGPDGRLTDYEGPASLVTFLCKYGQQRGVDVGSIVVEVPHYPFLEMNTYPRSILSVVARLEQILGINTDCERLMALDTKAQEQLAEVMNSSAEMRDLVAKLEAAYDQEELAEDDESDELLRRLINGIDAQGSGDQN